MPITVGRLEIIENAGPNSLQATLKKLLARAVHAEVQVAFVTRGGIERILPRLRQVASRGGRVRLVTGLYQGFTEAAALSELLAAQEQTNGRIGVRLAQETHFHRKLYLARTGSNAHVIAGSSNLTTNGLLSGGELNLLVSSGTSSTMVKRLLALFDSDWKRAFPLTRARIQRYKKLVRPTTRPLPAGLLSKVLGKRASHEKANDASEALPPRRPRVWVDGISGYARKETEAVLADETNWDTKGFQWYSAGTASIRPGDRIVLFDQSEKIGWIRIVHVCDYTKTATRTPDGWHFVAYTAEARTARRKITRAFLSELRRIGIAKWNGKRVVVAARTWKKVMPMFAQ